VLACAARAFDENNHRTPVVEELQRRLNRAHICRAALYGERAEPTNQLREQSVAEQFRLRKKAQFAWACAADQRRIK